MLPTPDWLQVPSLFGPNSIFGEDALGNLLAAGFGAFFGAVAASRYQSKKDLISELNRVASARALCFSVANTFMSLKKQHVRRMRRDFVTSKREFLSARRAIPARSFQRRIDLQTLTPPRVPTVMLEQMVLEKLSIRGRPLVAAVTLVNAIDGLFKLIDARNQYIEEWRSRESVNGGWAISDLNKFEIYFGTRSTGLAVVDERLMSFILGIYRTTDDCIFFSRVLEEDLFRYASTLYRKNWWRYRLGLPRPTAADWSIAEREGLMPAEKKYQTWLRAFKQA